MNKSNAKLAFREVKRRTGSFGSPIPQAHRLPEPTSAARAGRGQEESLPSPGAWDQIKDRLALTVREVAALLGISSAAVRLMIARGELPARKIGGGTERVTHIIPTQGLRSWLEGAAVATAGNSE